MRRFVFATSAIVCLASALACSSGSTVKIGWASRAEPGHLTCRYRTFSGREVQRFSAEEGQMITLDYEATVHKGSLTIAVRGPEGDSLWHVTLREDHSAHVEIFVPDSGLHTLVAEGKDTGGDLEVRWQVVDREPVQSGVDGA